MKLLLQGQRLPVEDGGDLRDVVLMSGARGSADTIELEIEDRDVVEIETEEGDRLMISADRLAERLPGNILVSRSDTAGDALVIRRDLTLEIPPELAAMAPTRGMLGWVIRRLLVRRPREPAAKLAAEYEDQNVSLGLNLWRRDATLAPVQGVLAPDPGQQDQPWLLFLHGTGSSTLGSFGKLPGGPGQTWEALQLAYAGRVLAFDHRSLTEDPVQNALTLLGQLPRGIELHLVSHSRGGLIGELLALGHLAEPQDGSVLRPSDLALFEGPARDRLDDLGRLLAERQIRVTRFVRVACPARGTRIADGRLGDWLAMVFNALARSARILGEAPAEHAEALARIASAALAGRNSPDALPGVAAMAPAFSPLVKMLNDRARKLRPGVSDGLVVIAGDLEFSTEILRLMLFFLDCFYGSDHDLVVNTSLMEGGLPRQEPLVLLDRGASVTHFGYFGNPRTAGQLRDGLLAPDRLRGIPSPARQLAETESRDLTRTIVPGSAPEEPALVVIEERAAPALSRGTGRPLAVILPGISGSHLAVDGERVWLNPLDIVLGGIARLGIDQPRVGPEGVIESYYGDLREHLSRTHETLTLAYDWRLSVQTTGAAVARVVREKLGGNPQRPVHVVGHSMGGLVARMALRDPALMQAFLAHADSRFLMAGTPNGGSLAMALGLLGHSRTVKLLATFSLAQDTADITAIMRKWPGAVQLLPPDLLETPAWQALAAAQTLDARAVTAARAFWRLMQGDAGLPPGRCLYLAGMGTTCDRLFSVAPAGAVPDLRMTTTTRGDGTVLWSSGIPAGVPAWYAPSEHGDLCKDRYLHPAISDLLLQGRTEVPRVTRDPGQRGLVAPAASGTAQPADQPLPIVPSPLQVLAATMGGRPPALLESAAPRSAEVRVQVVHDDLRHARYPILVGHGLGEAIRSAEQALDRRLNGRLSRRNALGLHPGLVGTWDVHVFADPQAADGIAGGIVVGTGVMSSLNTAGLTAAIRAGLLAYADAVSDLTPPAPAHTAATEVDTREAPAGRALGVSAVLIGSGSGVVSVADSVSALLNGVEQANRILASQAGDGAAPRFAELQIIESVEQIAVTAWHALGQRIERMRDPFLRPGPLVQGEGGYRRTGPEADPDSWMEVTITAPPPAVDAPPSALGPLHYLLVDGRARVEARTVASSRRLVRDYVAQIPGQSSGLDPAGLSPGRTLFELLWPSELKQHSLEDRNLRLVLDRDSATIPWEMLDDRRPDDLGRYSELLKPPAVRYGLMRQLVSQRSQPTPARRGGPRSALVIGDPAGDGRLPALPNARDEALDVSEQLRAAGFAVTTLIGADAAPTQVVSALFSRGWSVIHVASHGVVGWQPTPDDPPMTGILLGAPPLAVLEAPLLRQLPEPPDMVFLNCCHLGLITAGDPLGLALHQDRPGFAASMAVELIEMGCSAVVACGWAVDDGAARNFALTLYRQLCEGTDYGTALRQARGQAWAAAGLTSNTWAAYQCYGHPGFVLIPTTTERYGTGAEPASPSEALSQIRAAIARRDAPGQRPLSDQLAELERRIDRQGWQRLSDLAAALGDGWLACGDNRRAAEAYRRALAATRPSLPLSSLQRSAALLDGGDPGNPEAWIGLIEALNLTCQPSLERHLVLAGLFRRRATEAATKATRQKVLRRMIGALQDALSLAEPEADPERADALRLELLVAQALSSSPPGDLKARLAVLLAQRGDRRDHDPLLALAQAVVHDDPSALPAGALLRDPASLHPLARLVQAGLPPGSALHPALRDALVTTP